MNNALPETLFMELSGFLESQMGLHFGPDRRRDLERGMGTAALELGFEDVEPCARWLLSSPLSRDQIELLSSHLTVGETYFFREQGSFEILRNRILPDLINAHLGRQQCLRIWSAACCTGEEPYSLAILLDQVLPGIADWNITILATDINSRFLQKARRGVYTQWSFRDAPPWLVEGYFERVQDNCFEVLPRIREMVTFSYLNLAEDAYPSLLSNTNGMDLILCRNVLMYFAPERSKQVAERLYLSLVDGGWLLVGPSELSETVFPQFTSVNYPRAILYRKDGKTPQLAKEPPTPLIPELAALPEKALRDRRPVVGARPYEVRAAFPKEVTPPLRAGAKKPAAAGVPAEVYADAFALYESGHYASAEYRLASGISLCQREPAALVLMARICANQGKLVEALGWCDKALSSDKMNPVVHYLRAAILQEQGGDDEAATALKRALYLDQGFVLAHVALGHIAMRQGKVKNADRHFANALSALKPFAPGDALPEADGMTAERLKEMLERRNPCTRANVEAGVQ